MKILFASSEVAPFSKTGGLGDVAYALPAALAERGHEVLVLSPLYGCVDRDAHGLRRTRAESPLGELWEAPREGRLRFAFLESPIYFARWSIYGDVGDFPDNAARFAGFSKSLLPAAEALGHRPDILHLNDWQTAAATYFARRAGGPPTVLTIHNLGYQGLFPLADGVHLFERGEIPEAFAHYGKLALLKGGIATADLVTTVSPTYAQEIRGAELGFGLDDLLRARGERLVGILNGIDVETWDPAADPEIQAPFDVEDRRGKSVCKRALQAEFGLPEDEGAMLVGMVTRIAGQKGFDLLLPILEGLVDERLQLAILGSGDPEIEATLRRWAARHPGKLAVHFDFDEKFAHRIYAGSDAFLMPSSYEPCGLAQLYALRYGALPIVRATGGLRDTVRDGSTGFVFEDYRPEALREAIARALAAFGDRGTWEEMVGRAMREDFAWDRSAAAYERAYAGIFSREAIAQAPSTW